MRGMSAVMELTSTSAVKATRRVQALGSLQATR
jgi:hypothetical protein